MDELLNCPFCGGEAEATENYEHSDYVSIDGFVVFCKKCGNGLRSNQNER